VQYETNSLSWQEPVRPTDNRMSNRLAAVANSELVYCAPRSPWKTAPPAATPDARAISKASTAKEARMWSATCQPITILVVKSITVARYAHPSPVLM
jgi:hypothetical protein